MKWFESIFKGKASAKRGGDGWYLATTADKAIRQMVLTFPAGTATGTEFSTLILPADKFPVLAMNSWCAGFCKINGKYVVIMRAGTFAEEVKGAGVTVAMSFCHMPSHPLFLVQVRVDAPGLGPKVRAKYPSTVPPLTFPIAEWVSSLNSYDRELVPSVLAAEPFQMVICEDSQNSNVVYMPNGRTQESFLPRAFCEFRSNMPPEARKVLHDEFKQLMRHDANIFGSRRNFNIAFSTEITKYMPLDKDPVFAKQG